MCVCVSESVHKICRTQKDYKGFTHLVMAAEVSLTTETCEGREGEATVIYSYPHCSRPSEIPYSANHYYIC